MTDQERIEALTEVICWALGEHPTEVFPGLPADWPRRKFYWRHELRRRFNAVRLAHYFPVPPLLVVKREPEPPT